jgi:hypothetical protein
MIGREIENDDKMLLIAGREAATKIVTGETRNNRRNSKYNPGGTNGVTESPSMEMD